MDFFANPTERWLGVELKWDLHFSQYIECGLLSLKNTHRGTVPTAKFLHRLLLSHSMGPSHPFLKLVAEVFSERQKDDRLVILSLDQCFSEMWPPVLSWVKKITCDYIVYFSLYGRWTEGLAFLCCIEMKGCQLKRIWIKNIKAC